MEDSQIVPIERAADKLLEAREESAGLRKQAADVQGRAEEKLRKAMHGAGKTLYVRDLDDGTRLQVRLQQGAESVLVRKRKARPKES